MNNKRGRKPSISSAFDESELQLIAKANEKAHKSKAQSRWQQQFDSIRKAVTVGYQDAGNFTKCVIVTPKAVHVGIAKRNPMDANNPAIAKNIAFYRAITEPGVEI